MLSLQVVVLLPEAPITTPTYALEKGNFSFVHSYQPTAVPLKIITNTIIMCSVAWLVGWALILEYTIGGSAVARGISPNLVDL